MKQPINLAEKVGPKLEPLTDRFSIALWANQVERFDYQKGCNCPVCVLEGKISSIYGILEMSQTAAQAGKGAA